MKLNYYICSYFKDESMEPFLQEEVPIENPNLSEIKELFGLPKDHQFSEMYKISDDHEEYFTKTFSIEFDFENYQYFFEATL